jgi:hypothetical protein
MRAIVKEVAEVFPTAIISGRSREKVGLWYIHIYCGEFDSFSTEFDSCPTCGCGVYTYIDSRVCEAARALLRGKPWHGYHGPERATLPCNQQSMCVCVCMHIQEKGFFYLI